MKTARFLFSALLPVMLLTGCMQKITLSPSGKMTKTERTSKIFKNLILENGFQVFVTTGSPQKVEIECDENILPAIDTYIEGSSLVVKKKARYTFTRKPEVNIYITMTPPSGIVASGGTAVQLTNELTTDQLKAVLSGGSRFTGPVRTGTLDAVLSGGSKLSLTGEADKASLILSGGSRAGGYDFKTNTLESVFSGGSRGDLTVHKSIAFKGSGGSRLSYKGNATTTAVSISGGSRITNAD